MIAPDVESSVLANEKRPCCVGNPDTAATDRCNRRTRDAQFRKWTEAENEHRTEKDIQNVSNYQYAQRDRSIAGPTEDTVQQEQKHNNRVRSQHYSKKRRAKLYNLRFRAQQMQQLRCKDHARGTHQNCHYDPKIYSVG